MKPDQLLQGEDLGLALRSIAAVAPHRTATYPQLNTAVSNEELLRLAESCAGALVADGVRRGDVVGLLAPAGPDLLAGLFGAWLAGAAVSVLPIPAWSAQKVAQLGKLGGIALTAGMRHVVVGAGCEETVAQLREVVVPGLRAVQAIGPHPSRMPLPRLTPDDLAVVQFTSGTTTAPRGVMLTHKAVMAGLRSIVISAEHSANDVYVQWMPYYHDMGLMGHLSYLLNGAESHVFEPLAFLRRPAELLRYFAAKRATSLTGMNFAYELLADAATPDVLDGLDLSAWRLAFNGAEPVSAATIERFTRTFGPAGVKPEVMYPVYGMAEATLAVTFPQPGTLPRTITVDRDELGGSGVVRLMSGGNGQAKTVVSVGEPVHGLELRLVDEYGSPVSDGRLGEFQIRGDMITKGYLRNAAQTADLFERDWLRSGDLGFRLGSEHYVVGRRKEMVIVHGQNYFPEDAETIARRMPGVYRQRAVAVATTETGEPEHIAVIAETTADDHAREALRREIREQVVAELGMPYVRVHLVEPRFLTRTTSGKWQRLLAAQRIREAVAT